MQLGVGKALPRLALISAMLAMNGCADYSPREVAEPNAITVRDAFLSVADGLKGFQDSLSERKDFHLGVITCSIVIKFNVAATAARGGTEGVQLSPPVKFVQAKLSAQQNNNSTGERGNTIEVDLKSIDTHVCPPTPEKPSTDTSKTSQGGSSTGDQKKTSK